MMALYTGQHECDAHGGSRKDLADQVLRNYYNILSIDYRMGQRAALDHHVGVNCDGCNAQNFTGGRYRCTEYVLAFQKVHPLH